MGDTTLWGGITMASSFDQAIEYTLKNEGGFSNSRFDNGGCTKYGITMATLSRARQCPVTPVDIGALKIDEAKSIYLKFYWTPLMLDQVKDASMATCIFDIAVLRGPGTSTRYAQNSANKCNRQEIGVDCKMGPETVWAINLAPRAQFIPAFVLSLKEDLATIVADNLSQKIFIGGWLARADRLKTLV
jgi:lysozyme family protein